MPFPSSFLASSTKALTRSLLFSLGIDHVLIDFLARTSIGATAVLLAILCVGIGSRRRSRSQLGRDTDRKLWIAGEKWKQPDP